MPRTITLRDECVALELDEEQAAILDRALTGFAKTLQAARDMGVISHDVFCADADKARGVQFQVWDCKEKFETVKRHLKQATDSEGQKTQD